MRDSYVRRASDQHQSQLQLVRSLQSCAGDSRNIQERSLVANAGLLLSAFSLLIASPALSQECQREEIAVFSQDARFVRMHGTSLQLLDVGNLWWADIDSVFFAEPLPNHKIAIGKRTSDPAAHLEGFLELDLIKKQGSHLVPQHPAQTLFVESGSSFTVVNRGGKAVVLADVSTRPEDLHAQVLDTDLNLRDGIDLAPSGVTAFSCTAPGYSRFLYGNSQLIELSDTGLEKPRSRSLPDFPGFQRWFVSGFSSECNPVVVGIPDDRLNAPRVVLLWDLSTNTERMRLEIIFQAEFYSIAAVEKSNYIVLPEVQFQRVLPELGPDSPLARSLTGRLVRISYDGTEAELQLPPDTRTLATSCGGRRGYLFGDGTLFSVNYELMTIEGQVQIPFSWPTAVVLRN